MYKLMNQNPEDFHNGKLAGVKNVHQLIWNELEDKNELFFDNVLSKEFEHFFECIRAGNGLTHFNTYIFLCCKRDSLKAYYRQFIKKRDDDLKKHGIVSISDLVVDDERSGVYYRCDKCIFTENLVKYIALSGSIAIFSPHDFELEMLSEKILSCFDEKRVVDLSAVAQAFCQSGCLVMCFFWANGEAVLEILS